MENGDFLDRRQSDLEDALLELMAKLPYSRITVHHLSHRAGISRKTFYRTFADKDACLASLIGRHILNCHRRLNALPASPQAQLDAYIALFAYWQEQRSFMELLVRQELWLHFLQQIYLHLRDVDPQIARMLSTPEVPCDSDVLLFYATGTTALLLRWFKHGCAQPPEEMARKLLRLSHTGLLQYDGTY